MSQQPLDEQPVAPADARAEADDPQEGVHPIVVNPDQPLFPKPYGVSDDDLKAQGVDHGYVGLGGVEAPSGPTTEEAEGADASGAPEGKPADPDAAEKAKAAAQVAAEKRVTQSGQPAQGGQQSGGSNS